MNAEETCSVVYTLRVLGKKWTPWILCELLVETEEYFSDLLDHIIGSSGTKISARVLSETLSLLEEMKIINRVVDSSSMPIRVKYSLTEKGRDLGLILAVIKGWGIKYGGIEQKLCKTFRCVHNSIPMINIDQLRDLSTKEPYE